MTRSVYRNKLWSTGTKLWNNCSKLSISKWHFFEVTHYRSDAFFEVNSFWKVMYFSKWPTIKVTHLCEMINFGETSFSKWFIFTVTHYRCDSFQKWPFFRNDSFPNWSISKWPIHRMIDFEVTHFEIDLYQSDKF